MQLICDDTNCSVGVSSPIPKGVYVVEYVGELVLHEDAMVLRRPALPSDLKNEGNLGWPYFQCGNEGRFINHSYIPSYELNEWEWANGARLGIFAATYIPSLQEPTFRYRDKNLKFFACQ
ncbi:hypothetical protein PHMEG_00027256 [Phytophthora megakarya]|uniref:SET domain-containing protein n=1 Tax=Phytophthora megakarya TaxID=4795 RepID=A0A225V8S4_9STRA|nr:hypothetical protein PHMEG_00027256 [Phytophthora megakarya]